MKISELSRKTNVSIRMIRYYEKKELLQPTRTSSGYRCFNKDDI
ncbi:MerR family DNA-binding transcriptional regulator [Celerinatantimonas sp. YJH-8]